jgi:hypothetical protein
MSKDDERPEGEKPKNVLAMPDPAEEAKKLLVQVEANLETMARHHRALYNSYIKQGFLKDQADKYLCAYIAATIGNVR